MSVGTVSPLDRLALYGVAPRPWVQSATWDAFWMFSGIWGSLLLLALGWTAGWARAAVLLFVANGVLGLAHSYSTTYMILGSETLREARARNRFRYVYLPLAILAVGMTIGILTALTASFPKTARFGYEHSLWLVYIGLFWVGHFWHFGKQDFGVLALYAAKAGQNDARTRRVDHVHAMGMMLIAQPVLFLNLPGASPLGDAFYSFVHVSPAVFHDVATAVYAVACAATLAVVALELARPRTSLPKIAYYGIMLAHPSVYYFAHTEFKLFYFTTYLWSHWFVAIGLVSRIHTNHHLQHGRSRAGAYARHWLTIGALVLMVSIAIAPYEHLAIFGSRDYKEILAAVTPAQRLVVGVALGAFLAEQLVHYYCDRCLFRRRDPEIHEAIGPLL